MKTNHYIGGFAAINNGRIENCYSRVKIDAEKITTGGFVGKNDGNIKQSFCRIGSVKLTGGFTGGGNGTSDRCYFFHKLPEKNKELKKLPDRTLGQSVEEIKNKDDISNLSFDLENIWDYKQDIKKLRFKDNSWIYDIKKSPRYKDKPPIAIHTADELRDLAKRINEGDKNLGNAYIVLDDDINLGGKEWIPIGKERPRAFTGIFDGCGHSITNFVITDKNVQNKGLFGFLNGEVYNLSVDCKIKSNGVAGGIAAICEDGTIGCCSAVVDITGKDSESGGIAGTNNGFIFQSYSAGRIRLKSSPWILLLLLALALLLLGLNIFLPMDIGNRVFAPVPFDPDAIADPDAETAAPNTDGNFVSFQFDRKVDVDLNTGLCTFNFRNPGESNHNTVVQLQLTDNKAIKAMGSTGRTAAEQAKLEANPEYDPSNYRTVIAESGTVAPGYKLDSLRLSEQPNGATLKPGEYNAIIYLIFYDIKTNNRAMLESQLPVVIDVHR